MSMQPTEFSQTQHLCIIDTHIKDSSPFINHCSSLISCLSNHPLLSPSHHPCPALPGLSRVIACWLAANGLLADLPTGS